MFKRDVIYSLEKWVKKTPHKPLVLRGARQVGKTTVVNQFGEQFDNYLYVNLEDKTLNKMFNDALNVSDLLTDLFANCGKTRQKGSTLLFIDEIQCSPAAVAMLRYFYEQLPDVHVVAAGSLLESLIDRHISFPVGRVEYMAMRPCSFREFLTATGNNPLRERIAENHSSSVSFHQKLISAFNRYALIGGMPEVVNAYIENQDLMSLNSIYDTLLQGYRDDIEKYASNHTQSNIIRYIINNGWAEAGRAITLNHFAGSEYRSREVGESLRTMEKAMLLELAYPVTQTQLPILPDHNKSPKLLWLDTGLVNYSAHVQKEVFGASDLLDVWRGSIAEQVAGQELLTLSNSVGEHRNFWVRNKKNSNAEVDFVYQFDSQLIPIEVKSGHNSHLRSLHSFADNSESCPLAVRIWSEPLSVNDVKTVNGKTFKLINLPFYLIGFLPEILKKEI